MQKVAKDIYNAVSEKNDIPFDLVKSVGDAVFEEWNKNLKNPKSIILKIKKLGRMYLRRNKLLSKYSIFGEENKAKWQYLVDQYEIYVTKRRAILADRRSQIKLIPKIEPDIE